MKIVFVLAIATTVAAFPNTFYKVNPALIDKTAVTTDTSVKNTALGSCGCDITANSCDAYCCCDLDCDEGIRNFWKSDYDNYCAKNFIGSAFRPLEKCIDKKHVYKYQKRMGMNVSETESQLCVELDSSSALSTYLNYIGSFEGTPKALKYPIADIINIKQVHTSEGRINAF